MRTVVPAAPDAWITALRRYGTMSFGEVAAAAIRLARDGFPMYPLMAASLKRHEADHRAWPSLGGDLSAERPRARSRRHLPPDRSRRLVAIHGRRGAGRRAAAGPRGRLEAAHDAFYRGDIAKKIVAFMKDQGGLLSAEDLAELPLAGRPARAPPLWRSRSLHLRRLVPGAGAVADPGLARRHRSQGPRPQQRRLCPPFGRGAEARLCRPRGLLRRPGDDRGAAARP